jgi:transcriptional regulator with XRE-family HTH domain
MNTTDQTQQARLLTPEELAILVKLFREMRQWSQELLGEISGLSVRTIQRVETGLPSGLDTRRALARAFELEDIDALNKPYPFPTEEELKAEKEKFDRENIMLKALPLTTGKQLAGLVEMHSLDLTTAAFELPREADEQFAEMTDYFREYRDCAELYSQCDKFNIYDDLQNHIDTLRTLEVSLCYATRKVTIKSAEPDAKPWPTSLLYIVAFPVGEEPTEFATPRSARIGL